MKKAAIFSFSLRGEVLADRMAAVLANEYEVRLLQPKGDLTVQTGSVFHECDLLIFVGACGIAVRAIAPYVVSKMSDPAVLVTDEQGMHVISLLSGHIGGANDLTLRIAAAIGADPVITTATDVNGRFAVDAWAEKNGLIIEDMDIAKAFSVAILQRDVAFTSELPVEGKLPPGIRLSLTGDIGAAVSFRRISPFGTTLLLIPRVLHLGIGCRRGVSAKEIEDKVMWILNEYWIDWRSIASVSSIDLKKDEPGLQEFAYRWNIPSYFYTAEQLQQAPGTYTASEFVQDTVGVDNVCERAAVLSAGAGGRIIISKVAGDGITVAIAMEDRRLTFE